MVEERALASVVETVSKPRDERLELTWDASTARSSSSPARPAARARRRRGAGGRGRHGDRDRRPRLRGARRRGAGWDVPRRAPPRRHLARRTGPSWPTGCAQSTAGSTRWSTTPASRPASGCRTSRSTMAADVRHQRHRPAARHPGAGAADAARLVDRQHLLGRGRGRPRRRGVHVLKWALRGLTRTASLELGSTRGIRVNAVMPGLIDTPLMASASPAFSEAALAEIPLGRVGDAGRHRADHRVPRAPTSRRTTTAPSSSSTAACPRTCRTRASPTPPGRRHEVATARAQGRGSGRGTTRRTCCPISGPPAHRARPRARAGGRRRRAARRAVRLRRGRPAAALQAAQRPRLRHLRVARRGGAPQHRRRGGDPGGVVRRPALLLHQPARPLRPGRADPEGR